MGGVCLFLTLLHPHNIHGEMKAASDANYEGKSVFFFHVYHSLVETNSSSKEEKEIMPVCCLPSCGLKLRS